MCVIVHQPSNAHIDKETARKLWQANPDGGGFAFVDDNQQLQVQKFMAFPAFWSAFEQERSAHTRRDFLLHMRIATHGAVTLENVHPFSVDEQTVMAHNGIIHEVAEFLPLDDSVSDTRYFVDNMLPQLPKGWQDSYFYTKMVEGYIGWSKLMFLTVDEHLDKKVYRLGDWDQYKGLYLTNLNGLTPKKTKGNKINVATHYYETSEDWNTYQSKKLGVVSEWETDMMTDSLKRDRQLAGIKHEMLEFEGCYECEGCLEEIDIFTGECACFDMVCLECLNWVANCKRQGRCYQINIVDFDVLTQEGKDKVYAASDQPSLELVVYEDGPEGEGNTNPRQVSGWSLE